MVGYRKILAPTSVLGATFPPSSWNLGRNWAWIHRKTAYYNHTHDIISIVPWPIIGGMASFYTCSVDVLKQLLGNESRTRLVKPLDITLHRLWGDSLAASSGEIWKRHRRVVAPAFHNKIFSKVRTEATHIFNEMVESEGWTQRNEVFIADVKPIALKFTLVTIGRCGFGLPMTWSKKEATDGTLEFEEAISIASETLIPRFFLFSWVWRLPIKAYFCLH